MEACLAFEGDNDTAMIGIMMMLHNLAEIWKTQLSLAQGVGKVCDRSKFFLCFMDDDDHQTKRR